jgi:hypothetical protein
MMGILQMCIYANSLPASVRKRLNRLTMTELQNQYL